MDTKFGKINPEDFATKVYTIDSNASAVVIADIGSSEIIGNSKGWFSLVYKHHRRVHILNKNGYNEANVEIPLYTMGDDEEELKNVRAASYNLENGEIITVKLEKENLFKDKKNKNLIIKKFTFPNVKAGTIIEYEYTIVSDFLFNLQPWNFQGSAPVLWSEYKLALPEFLSYIFLTQGYHPYFINEHNSDNKERYTVREARGALASEMVSFDADVTNYRWVMKEVPALKEESFTSTLKNHISKIQFQLSDYRFPLTPRKIMTTWPALANDLLRSEDFGSTLDKNNGWLKDTINYIISDVKNSLEKANRVYAYIRDNFICIDHNTIYLNQSLKSVFNNRRGNVAEINLLLSAMLRYINLEADPVLLSTSTHGYTYPLYPILNQFNYVICKLNIEGKEYYLDASQPFIGFGKLNSQCYNGCARVINQTANALELPADSLLERKVSAVMLNINEKGELIGTMQQLSGYYESYNIRKKIKEQGKADFFKEIRKVYGQEAILSNTRIDSLNNLENPVDVVYDFTLPQTKSDIIYINPMFGEGYKANPFASAERFYPIEMPYTTDETYTFNMTVPDGYMVDELPKSLVVKLNEQGDGKFEYRIELADGIISMRSRIILKRTYYSPDEYDMLREFYSMIVKKHNEQIVLKKKK